MSHRHQKLKIFFYIFSNFLKEDISSSTYIILLEKLIEKIVKLCFLTYLKNVIHQISQNADTIGQFSPPIRVYVIWYNWAL